MRVRTAGGEVIELGTTETAPTIGIIDYSRRVTDDFGVTTVVPRGFARRMSVRLALRTDTVDAVQRRLADLRATAATWIADDRFAGLSVEGFYKDFELDLAVPPVSFCTLTVEGLAAAEPAADGGEDPAPAGSASTLRLLDPFVVGDAALIASSAAENDHPEWSPATTYPLGARVVRATAHRIYESAAAANVGNDPAAATGKWVDIGPTNRWAMFDQALGSVTSAAGSITVTISAGKVDAVALLDVVAATVRVQAPGYDRTLSASTGTATFLDLPGGSGQVTVTITGAGEVEAGTLLIGRLVALGVTEAAPTAGITDFSRKEVDDFGETTVVQRAWARRMTARAMIATDALDVVANRIAAARARPALWIADSDLESLRVYGFFKDFSIEVGEAVSKLSLTIEGLSTAGKVEPLKVAVDWPEISDPDGTKPANNADVTGENTSADTNAVAGVPAVDVISDRRVTAETLIEQSLNSYTQRQRVIAQLYLNGVPVRAIAQVLTEARVDEQGNAFARAGLEVDANGVIGGIFITSDGSLAQFKVAADGFLLLRPGTDGSDPDDVLLSVIGNKTILHDVEVDTLKVGTVTPVEMVDGATGEAGWSYDDAATQVNSQSTWQNIDSITITPRHGKPVMVMFTAFAQNISDSSTNLRYRIVRDDGTAVYGTANGRIVQVKSKGEPVALRAIDGSTLNRPTTYTWQGKKTDSNDVVQFNDRIATVEEHARMLFQNFDVATSNPTEGPAAGTGGGGGPEPYDPNPWPYRRENQIAE